MNLSIEFWLQIAVYLVTIAAGGVLFLHALDTLKRSLINITSLLREWL